LKMGRRKDGGMAAKMQVQAVNEWVVLSLDAWDLDGLEMKLTDVLYSES
jgi:hypothetical protein